MHLLINLTQFLGIAAIASGASAGFKVAGFNAKALTNDSDFTPAQKNIVRVYGTRFCPYTYKMLLILATKNIKTELVSINTKNPPEWYAEKVSEQRKIPCVEYNEKIVCGSTIAGEWLDDEFNGTRKVMPKNPYQRAKQKMMLQRLDHAKPAEFLYKALYFRVGDHRTFGSYEIEAEKYEKALQDNYLAGAEAGWIDYMLWPYLEKIDMIPLVFKNWPVINEDPPKFGAYLRRMNARPEVRALKRPPKEHLKYLMSVLKEKIDFDVGL